MKTVFSAFSMLAYDDLQLDNFIVDFSTSSTDGTPGGSVSTDMDAASAASVSGVVNMEYGGGALDSHISVSDSPPTATAFDSDSGSPIIVQIAPDNVQNEGNITDHFTGGGGFVFSTDVVTVINTDILITAATGPDSGLVGDGNFAIVLDSIVDSFEPTATNDSSVISDDANDFAVISGLTDSTGNLESSPISLDVYPSGSGSIVSDNSFVAREGSALGFDSSALSAEPANAAPLGALSSEFTSNPNPAYIYNTAVEVHNPAALSEGSAPPSSVPSIMTFGDLGESPASLVQTSSAAPGNASSGLVINITYDSSVNNAPAGFEAVVASVVQFYESEITNPITLNIDVGWGEIAQQGMMSGALGESESYLEAFSYSQIRSALIANATSSTQLSAFNALPTSAPVNGPFYLTLADATALGLYSSGTTLDGYVGFSSSYPFAYNDSTGVPAGEYDLYGVVAHEITEVMGRISMVASSGYSDLDLLRYSAPGVFSTSTGYVSSNGGNTVLNYLNSNPGGDLGDWASSAGNDAYNAFSNSGVVNSVTQADLTVMNILGYGLASQTSQTPTAPTVTDQTANQTWAQNKAVNFTLAANTFTDPQQEALTYSATLSTGAALPAWLHFNAATETFTGTVPSGASGLSIEVTATDTSGLSASETFAVVTPLTPTVNANSFTVAAQQSVAASSFFTISNPSSDSITEYSFNDNGGGSGHFTLAGTTEPDGQVITVSAANLSSVQYVGGASAGSDTLIADAYDATTGAWVPSVSLSAVTTAPFPLANNNDVTEAVYIGYFGRAGDPSGGSYWFDQLNNGNISEAGMAASFSVQPEAQALYSFLAIPSSATQAQITSFIESVYQDLFNRAADSSGLAYWQNNLTSNLGNPQAVGAFILNVISGAQGSDQTTIINKVTVADYFTQELASAGISFTSAANTLAHSAIASVTSASSTVLAAESTISSWVTTTTQSTGVEVPLVGTSDTSPLSTVHYI
jgi:hypothetical protein